MKNHVLLELVGKWERDAEAPECQDGSPEAQIENAVNRGVRAGKRRCAEDLNMLIKVLGDDRDDSKRSMGSAPDRKRGA